MDNSNKFLKRYKELIHKNRRVIRNFALLNVYAVFMTIVCLALIIYAIPTESKVTNAEVIEQVEPVETVVSEEVIDTKPIVSEKYVATAYCACKKCCGKTDGITASGVKAVQGVTVAMNKSIPFGTRVYIEGVGERVVQDRGGAIKGNRVDIFFNSHSDALKFGRRTVNLTVLGDK